MVMKTLKDNFTVKADWLFLNQLHCGYLGFRQAEGAVVVRGLLCYWRLIAMIIQPRSSH